MKKICDLQTASEKYRGHKAAFHVYVSGEKYIIVNDNISKPVFETDSEAACKNWYLDMKVGQVTKLGII